MFSGSGGSAFNNIFESSGVTNHPMVMGKSAIIQDSVSNGDTYHDMGGYATGSSAKQSTGLSLSGDIPIPTGLNMLQNLAM